MPDDRSYLKRGLLGIQKIDVFSTALRLWMIRAAGASIHQSAYFEPSVSIISGQLVVGANAYINRGTLLDARGGIHVGDRTLLGPNITILTASHPVMASYPRAGPVTYEPVVIESDVWIGANVTILSGSIIRRGTVVAAGSVVRGTLEADTLYAGVPARKKRQLDLVDGKKS